MADRSADSDCIIHFAESKPQTTLPLTAKTVKTLNECVDGWLLTIKEPERSICENAKGLEIEVGKLVHPACYSKITDKPKLARAKSQYSIDNQSADSQQVCMFY